MPQGGKQLPILPLQLSPRHELHINTVRKCEEFAGIGDLFSFHLAKLPKSLCADVGVHGKNFAERAHNRAVAEFTADTAANPNQFVLIEELPGAQAIEVGGQSIKPLHGLERWRRLTCKLFDKASLRRHGGGGGSFPRHDGGSTLR